MKQTSPHIVVVDDEEDLREMVQDYLIDQGFLVSQVDGGENLALLMAERPVDLVLLDINMPGEDGLSIARKLKARGDIGIIMVTANGDTIDRVVGLELGADDYIAKPFDLRELLARVRAVLRRASAAGQQPATMGNEVRFGDHVLNLDTHRLYAADGRIDHIIIKYVLRIMRPLLCCHNHTHIYKQYQQIFLHNLSNNGHVTCNFLAAIFRIQYIIIGACR